MARCMLLPTGPLSLGPVTPCLPPLLADIAILTHSTTIQPRYQAVIHCEIVRQAARVVAMDRERLRRCVEEGGALGCRCCTLLNEFLRVPHGSMPCKPRACLW